MDNTNTDRAALESLQNFAYAHGEMAFGHMVTAALLPGGEWEIKRATDALDRIEALKSVTIDVSVESIKLRVIRSTDTTNPDGSTARSLKL